MLDEGRGMRASKHIDIIYTDLVGPNHVSG
jgi:hypothetical protein